MGKLHLLESILKTIANDPHINKYFVLRGSILFKQRISKSRIAKDIDFFVDPKYFKDKGDIYECLLEQGKRILSANPEYDITIKNISDDDGLKIQKCVLFDIDAIKKSDNSSAQIVSSRLDIGCDCPFIDYEYFEYRLIDDNYIDIKVSPIYISAAWKIQLIIGGNWRPKDVYDLYLIMKILDIINFTHYRDNLYSILFYILDYRKIPIENMGLFINEKFGKSGSARKKWKKWQQTENTHSIDMDTTFQYLFKCFQNTF